jgi:RNA polymerase sigma-70 factor, ECF subfamily
MDNQQAHAEFLARLRKARAGDREELGRLLETFRVILTHRYRRLVPAHVRARFSISDVVQQTMIEAWRDFDQFQSDSEEELLRWLQHLLLNNFRNLLRDLCLAAKRDVRRETLVGIRQPAGHSPQEPQSPEPSPLDEVCWREDEQSLRSAIATLPEHYQQAIRGRIEGLTYDEIGRRIGCSSGAARKLYTRALLWLGQRIHRPPPVVQS